ncbi:MAG: GC-type dockerin domain-anchored protein [Phycisphaerales bacterium]
MGVRASGRVVERVGVLIVAAGLPVAVAGPVLAQSDPLEQPWLESQSFTSMRGSFTAWQAVGVQDLGLLGFRSAAARDVNGDGVGDAIFSASNVDVDGRRNAGEVYVVFGQADLPPGVASMSFLDGSNGFTFRGAAADDFLGRGLGSGDFNGDGLSDVVIGAPSADPSGSRSGETYVVFGRSDGFPAALGPGDLDGTTGFRIPGLFAGGYSGATVDGVGDLNGDGVDDLMVVGDGIVYVVFGSDSGFNAEFDLSTLDGDNGFRLVPAGSSLGGSISAAGDVNGDGVADAVVGGARMAFVLFGRRDGFEPTVLTSELDGTNGFAIDGRTVDDSVGATVSTAGDINGDGFDDVATSAPYAGDVGDGFRAQGFVFVVFGGPGSRPPVVDLSTLDGSNGFRMEGATSVDGAGTSLAGGADLNGDGLDDLVVGAPGTGYAYTCYYCGDYTPGEGSAFVIYGRNAHDPVIDLADVSADRVVRFDGPRDSQMAYSMSGMTDFNADGRPDFLLGAIDGLTPDTVGLGTGMVIYGRGPAEPCAADLDGDGELTIFDFLGFQIFFDIMDPRADFDGDGDFTIFDFLAFQTAFDAGC